MAAIKRRAASVEKHPDQWKVTLECGHTIGGEFQKPLSTEQKDQIVNNGHPCVACERGKDRKR